MGLPIVASVPSSPVRDDGHFEIGSYRGAFRDIDYQRVGSSAMRLLREKRWLWYCIVQDPWIIALAVVRTGYAANTFAFVQRVGDAGLAAECTMIGGRGRAHVQRRAGNTEAFFGAERAPNARVDSIGGSWNVTLRFAGLELDAECTHEAAPLGVVARVPGGLLNATEKGIGVCRRGMLRLAGQPEVELDGALTGYDLTHGLLGRRTAWRWAFGLGRDGAGQPIGFNLVSGFVGSAECATFGPSGPSLLEEPTFQFDARNYQRDWRLHGEGVDLTAAIGGTHFERKRLLLVRSDFLQAAATFQGALGKVRSGRWLGVVEDQDVIW